MSWLKKKPMKNEISNAPIKTFQKVLYPVLEH